MLLSLVCSWLPFCANHFFNMAWKEASRLSPRFPQDMNPGQEFLFGRSFAAIQASILPLITISEVQDERAGESQQESKDSLCVIAGMVP